MSTLFLPKVVKQYRDCVIVRPQNLRPFHLNAKYFAKRIWFSIDYYQSQRQFSGQLQKFSSLGKQVKTAEEAVALLKQIIPAAWYPIIALHDKPYPSQFHNGIGMWMRAMFGLYTRTNTELLKALQTRDPDQASYMIEIALWKNLRESTQSQVNGSL